MSSDDKPTLIGPLAGVVVGVVVFVGVNITTGRAIIPTAESVVNRSWGLSAVERPQAAADTAGEAAAGGAYQTVCQTCHQADGNGVPGAFPPLAGSEWATGDPETPVRIVLRGLKGEIEVKGVKFNSLMPPPPGLTDEQVVEAINHVRTSFGNNASEIDLALVQKVKASLEGRTEPWTAAELTALRGTGAGADEAGAAGGEGETSAPAAEDQPAETAESAAAKPQEAPPEAAGTPEAQAPPGAAVAPAEQATP